MRKYSFSGILVLAFIFLFFAPDRASSQAVDGEVGFGLMVGEPTGLSIKYWNSGTTALQGGLAWSVGRYDAVQITGDYVWHDFSIFDEIDQGSLPIYYGVGGRLVLGDSDTFIGVRIPVGINYLFEETPLGLFLELAPTVNLAPDTDFDMNGALGIRVYL